MAMVMASVFLFLITLFVLAVANLLMKSRKNRCPFPLPIIGHLHLLDGSAVYRSLFHLSKSYGALMLLQFGAVPTLVVSNAHAAEQVLKIHGMNFLSRPAFTVAEHTSYNYQSLVLSPYGEQWKKLRKICATLLLNRTRLDSFKALRVDMVSMMVHSVTHAAHENRVVSLRPLLTETLFNIITMMLMSKRYFGSGVTNELEALQFNSLQNQRMKLAGSFYPGDFFPLLKPFQFLFPNLRALKRLQLSQDIFLQGILNERRRQNKEEQQICSDFLDLLLSIAKEEKLSDDVIKALIQDLIDGATETTRSTIEWTVAELIRHPEVMKNLKQELGKVVGKRNLDEEDLSSLPYLECVIKETLRLHSPTPILVPRRSTEPCMIEGIAIPKNAMIIINWFAIGQNPAYWDLPHEFIPRRFMDNHGPNFMYIPFGGGRRSCPGELLGMTMVKLVVGSLIHQFDWGLGNGLEIADLDMSEDFAAILRIKNPLNLIPSLACNA